MTSPNGKIIDFLFNIERSWLSSLLRVGEKKLFWSIISYPNNLASLLEDKEVLTRDQKIAIARQQMAQSIN